MTHESNQKNFIKASPDLLSGGWIDKYLPLHWRAYAYLMRLDRPIGTWLLLWPTLWGLVFASGGLFEMGVHEWYLTVLFCIGAIMMRGAGCVINDLWDRDLDQHVERTKNRPLASGAISPLQAFIFLAVLLFAGLFILVQLTSTAILLGVCSLMLVVSYPLMKRLTWWPQAFLGVTFNFGILIGWASVTNSVDIPAWLLYAGAIFWTLGYDTIYAHQDQDDDALVGIKSTALKFGSKSPVYVTAFYTIAVLLWMCSGYSAGQPPEFFMLMLLPAAHLFWQVALWDPNHPLSCLKKFQSNKITGYLVFAAFSIF